MINQHPSQFLDSSFETLFASILHTACEACDVKIGMIAFSDATHCGFQPGVGPLDILKRIRATGLPEQMMDIGEPIEIPDISQDDRLWDLPFMAEDLQLKFLCVVPIKLPLGEVVGIMCLADDSSIYLNEHQRISISGFANVIAKALVARESSLKLLTKLGPVYS